MLYLLTILDIMHVGTKTWTTWKAILLKSTYERLKECLKNPGARMASADTADEGAFPPEHREYAQWLADLKPGELKIHAEHFDDFERLTVLAFDRLGFFADFSGCLSSEGYNILSAQVSSTTDGKILDVFIVEPDVQTTINLDAHITSIRQKWQQITAGSITANQLMNERLTRYGLPASRKAINQKPTVRIDNSLSAQYSVLEIEAADHFGLLFQIARTLAELKVNIVKARLSTRIDMAHDVFYLSDPLGLKIVTPEILRQITEKTGQILAFKAETAAVTRNALQIN
jgi:[protein-PII] uridylyltransferase